MKKITLLSSLLFVFFLTGCNIPKISDKEKENEKALVKKVLDKYRAANENQDIHLIEEIWCPDETIISFGTEKDERLVGFSQIKEVVQRQFNTFSETFITPAYQVIEISDDGRTAWFSQMMNYNFILNGEPYSFRNLRYTGVLVKKKRKWKLVQTHMSVAYNPLEK